MTFALLLFFVSTHIHGLESQWTEDTCGIVECDDKEGNTITLEWYKIRNLKDSRVLDEITIATRIDAQLDVFIDELVAFRDFSFEAGLLKEPAEDDEKAQELFYMILSLETLDREEQIAFLNRFQELDSSTVSEGDLKRIAAETVVVIAKEGDTIVGTASFSPKSIDDGLVLPENGLYLSDLGVHTDAQGRGIGRLLIFSFFEFFPDTTKVFLSTSYENHHAQNVFENLGFEKRECKEITGYGAPLLGYVFDVENLY